MEDCECEKKIGLGHQFLYTGYIHFILKVLPSQTRQSDSEFGRMKSFDVCLRCEQLPK